MTEHRTTVMEALAHQELPFQKIVEAALENRNPAYPPLCQTVFKVIHWDDEAASMPGIEQRFRMLPPRGLAFDLGMSVNLDESGGYAQLEFNEALFDPATARRWMEQYLLLLEAIVTDPEVRVGDLPRMTPEVEKRVLEIWNDTATPLPADSVDQLYAAQVERTPRAPVLVLGDSVWSYRELDQRANQLAHRLRREGLGRGDVVGLVMDRSFELVAAMLAVLKAGGAYLPITADDPAKRKSALLEDAGAKVLLTQQQHAKALPDFRGTLLVLDQHWKEFAGEPTTDPEVPTGADDLAYVMYTSGSTGVPKGVEILHRNIVRLAYGLPALALAAETTTLLLAPPSFDASTFELWGALLNGGRCVIYPDSIPTADSLGSVLRKGRVTTLWLTATLFNTLIDAAPEALANVPQILTGGEALSVEHIRRAQAALPDSRLFNGYGPTETTTFATLFPIPDEPDAELASIPIGRPIGNTQTYLLDESLRPVALGAVGEIHIGGEGLARGYLGDPALTASKFIEQPLMKYPGARLYKTGDLGRFRADGTLEFLGRVDGQVKLRGFRVEPGEIEAVLRKHDAVQDAAVVVQEDEIAGQRLVGYAQLADGSRADEAALTRFLKRELPKYMVPARIEAVEALPQTTSGKVDRRRLSEAQPLSPSAAPISRPQDPVEARLIVIWQEVLGRSPIATYDDFFDLGGHSLLALRMLARISTEFDKQLPVSAVFQAPTVAGLADLLREEDPVQSYSWLIPVSTGEGTPPFFGVHMPAALRKHIREHQPLYYLRYASPYPESVTEIAAAYLSELRQVQPRGPYYIGGFSFGAVVAYEMALQLVQMGEQIAFLCLMDPTPLGTAGERPPGRRGRWSAGFDPHLEQLAQRGSAEKLRYLAQRTVNRTGRTLRRAYNRGRLAAGRELEPDFEQRYAQETFKRQVRRYSPEPYAGPVLLISTPGLDNLAGWSTLLTGEVDDRVFGDAHTAFLEEPLVSKASATILEGLAEAQTVHHRPIAYKPEELFGNSDPAAD